jgi:phage terminase large subunit GpA-like protein
MLHDGAWVAGRPERSSSHRGFRLPTLYAADGLGPTWADLYQEQSAAQGDPVAVKTFVSTRGARAYESTEGKIEPDALQACREDWRMRDIPPGCLPLVASVDCQGNRFELKILGFGRGPTARDPQVYVIDYAVIPGSPLDPAAWVQLDEYLSRPLRNAYGVEQVPRIIAVDSGNWTREVYAECWERKARGWVPVKGSSNYDAPLISPPRSHEFNWRGKWIRHGGVHYIIGTHAAKNTLLGRLAIIPTQAPAARWWHLPADLPDAWFTQMTSERRDPETGAWEKVTSAARNECPDIAAYAWAVAHLPTTLHLGTRTERDWSRDETALQPLIQDLFDPAPVPAQAPRPVSRETPPPMVAPPPRPAAPARPRRGGGGWVDGWR